MSISSIPVILVRNVFAKYWAIVPKLRLNLKKLIQFPLLYFSVVKSYKKYINSLQ